MNSIHTRAIALSAFLALATPRLDAQDLDATVVRNPDDTVTYTLDVAGPPRGTFLVFFSPFALVDPIPLPGIGNLHLDPRVILPLGPARPIGSAGRGSLRLTVPLGVVNRRPLHFQALVIDPLGPARTTDFLTTWYRDTGFNFNGDPRLDVKSQPGRRILTGTVLGERDKIVEVTIHSGTRLVKRFQARVGADGTLRFAWGYSGYRIQHGDQVLIHYDGRAVGMIQY